jgi:hypothetical protein
MAFCKQCQQPDLPRAMRNPGYSLVGQIDAGELSQQAGKLFDLIVGDHL